MNSVLFYIALSVKQHLAQGGWICMFTARLVSSDAAFSQTRSDALDTNVIPSGYDAKLGLAFCKFLISF